MHIIENIETHQEKLDGQDNLSEGDSMYKSPVNFICQKSSLKKHVHVKVLKFSIFKLSNDELKNYKHMQ